MLVAVAVSARLLLRIRNALGSTHQITILDLDSSDWTTDVARADVLVLEPGHFRGIEHALIDGIRRSPPRSHIILSTSLHPADLRLVARFVRAGVRHVLISGVDDRPARLRDAIEGHVRKASEIRAAELD